MKNPLYLSADDFALLRQALDFNAARWTTKDNPSLDLLERLSTVPVFPGYALIHPGTLPVDVAPFLAGFECPDCDNLAADVPRCTSAGCPLIRQLRGELPADLPGDLPARSEFTPAMVDALRRVDNYLKGSQDYEHGQMRDGSCPALIIRSMIRGSVLPPADKPAPEPKRLRFQDAANVLRTINRYLSGVQEYEHGCTGGGGKGPTPAELVRAILDGEPLPDNGPGVLQIGTNEKGEVVLNLPRDMTGHIVFSVGEALNVAGILTKQATLARAGSDFNFAAPAAPVNAPEFVLQYTNFPEQGVFYDQPGASHFDPRAALNALEHSGTQMPGATWRIVERVTMEREACRRKATGPASDAQPPTQPEEAVSVPEGKALLSVCDKALRQWGGGESDKAIRLMLGMIEQIGLTGIAQKERVALLDKRTFNLGQTVHGFDAKLATMQGEVNGAVTLATQAKADALDVTRTVSAMNNGGL